jgi:adenosylhomocysteine nucleosidase
MQIVVLISANAEWRTLKSLFAQADFQKSPFGEWFTRPAASAHSSPVTFFHGGWGKVSAAATTQYVIDHFHPDLLVNLGTCGGFEGRIQAGALILVEKTLIYDILEQMSDPDEALEAYSTSLDLPGWGIIVRRPLSAVC